MTTPVAAVIQGFRQYAVFNGRATRSEYWWWLLFTIIGSIVLSFVDSIIGLSEGWKESGPFWLSLLAIIYSIIWNGVDSIIGSFEGWKHGPFETLFGLATLLPSVTVTARRLHDIGKTGWWQLGWLVIPSIAFFATGIMFLIAPVITHGATDPSGDWSGKAFADPLLAAIVILAVVVIVWWIIWLTRPGESGQNRFGPDPRAWAQMPSGAHRRHVHVFLGD